MAQKTVTVTNISETETFEDAWGGVPYRIGPGESQVVPEGVAHHWLGDPNRRGPAAAVERRRVLDRAGGRDPAKIVVIGAAPAGATKANAATTAAAATKDAKAAGKSKKGGKGNEPTSSPDAVDDDDPANAPNGPSTNDDEFPGLNDLD